MNFFTTTINRSRALGWAIVRKTREVGFVGLSKHAIATLIAKLRSAVSADSSCLDAFDSKYGTDTAKIVDVWALDIPVSKSKHAVRYETVAPEIFSSSMAGLPISHEEFVFIDLGSGKGRALLLASRFPFKEIVGVEISARLHTVASRNLQIFRDDTQKCSKIRAICQDVMDYRFPGENIVLYLYNPFDEQVMQTVVSKVEDFIRHSSKRIYVMYHNPRHRSLWDRSKLLEVIKIQNRTIVYARMN